MAEMIDQTILAKCRKKLEATARAGEVIVYSFLAKYLNVNPRSGLKKYLNAIYVEETQNNHPDLTTIVVSKTTGLGRFNSIPGPALSIAVDPKDRQQLIAYLGERQRVFDFWRKDER